MTIALEEISKRFGDQTVVSRLNLSIAEHELFVLLGASGSGKSTILRIIAGLAAPDTGVVRLGGRDVTALPPQGRDTGFVFQNYALFRHLSVAQNVEFGLKVRRVPAVERRRRREQMLELVGLGGLGDRMPGQLSGGQRQRVALARALVYQPSVLLLDEPFGALDLKVRLQLRRSLRELQKRLGVTTILVTHDQEEAFELGDRIGVLEHGRLAEIGTPEELYHAPKTEFAASFVGGGNVLIGRAEKGRIRLGETLLDFPFESPAHEDGSSVRILFRPETVLVSETPFERSSGVQNLGQGRLAGRTFAGGAERLHFDMDSLRGARPVEPAPSYGQRAARIDASRSSSAGAVTSGRDYWIGVRAFHVLQPSGLKVLAWISSADRTQAVMETVCRLGRATHGPIVALTIIDAGTEKERARVQLRQTAEAYSRHTAVHLECKIREGEVVEEILREAQENFYDLVVLPRPKHSAEGERVLSTLVPRLLATGGLPVLITGEAMPEMRRMLLCTSGGATERLQVQFAGRLARHTRAEVTLYPAPEEAAMSLNEAENAQRHLQPAQAALEALGVKAQLKVPHAGARDEALAEACSGSYDVVVVADSTESRRSRASIAGDVMRLCSKPVLVTPPELG